MSEDDNNTPEAFTLPEAYTGNAAFEGIDSLDSLASKYAETHQAHTDLSAGQPVIPENAESYEINVPEGQEAHPELMGAFKGWMHDAGVTNEKAQTVSDNFNKFIGDISAAQEVEKTNAENAAVDGLKKEWGTEFDGKAKIADNGLQRFFTEAGIDDKSKDSFAEKFGNDPVAIKLFHAIGSKIGESPNFDGDGIKPAEDGPGRTEGDTPYLHKYETMD